MDVQAKQQAREAVEAARKQQTMNIGAHATRFGKQVGASSCPSPSVSPTNVHGHGWLCEGPAKETAA